MSELFSYDPVLVLSAILQRNANHVKTPHGFVGMVNAARDEVTVEYGMGVGENYIGYHITAKDGVAGHVLSTGTPKVVTHYNDWDGKFRGVLPKNTQMIGMVAGTPVRLDGALVAVLVFIFESAEPCEGQDVYGWLHQVSENASHALQSLGNTTTDNPPAPMIPFIEGDSAPPSVSSADSTIPPVMV